MHPLVCLAAHERSIDGGHTPSHVKRLLPPRPSRGASRWGLEVNRGPERPLRSSVPWYQAADESYTRVVVLAEVEEGVAIVAVDPEVTPGKDLEPDAGVPAELGGFHGRVVRCVEQLHLPSVPTRTAQQVWRDLA